MNGYRLRENSGCLLLPELVGFGGRLPRARSDHSLRDPAARRLVFRPHGAIRVHPESHAEIPLSSDREIHPCRERMHDHSARYCVL